MTAMPKSAAAVTAARTTARRDAGDRAPAVTRAVQILRYLSRQPEPIGVNPLGVALGIVPSTCLHILRALTREGLVAFDPQSKRYRLGIGVLGLARSFLARGTLPVVVQPLLDDIARRRGVTAVLIERLNEDELIVSAVAQGSDMFSVKVTVGTAFPAYSSASGRCVAAYAGLTRARLVARFATLRWQSAPAPERWLAEVEAVPRRGYAVDDGHYIRGLTVISAPVLEPDGALLRCVAVVALKEQLSKARLATLVDDARAVARQLQRAQV